MATQNDVLGLSLRIPSGWSEEIGRPVKTAGE